VVRKCEQCGATLEGARPGTMVRCGYCGVESFVPEERVHVEPFRGAAIPPAGAQPQGSSGSGAIAIFAVLGAVVAIVVAGVVSFTSTRGRAEVARENALQQQRQAEEQMRKAMEAVSAATAPTAIPEPTAVPEPVPVDPNAGGKGAPAAGDPLAKKQAAPPPKAAVTPDVDAIAYDVLYATLIRSCVPNLGKVGSPGKHPRFDVATKMRFERGWAKDVTATVTMVDDPNAYAPRQGDTYTLGAPVGAAGKAGVESTAAACTKKAIEAHHFRSTKLQDAVGDVRMTLKFENDVTFQSGSSP